MHTQLTAIASIWTLLYSLFQSYWLLLAWLFPSNWPLLASIPILLLLLLLVFVLLVFSSNGRGGGSEGGEPRFPHRRARAVRGSRRRDGHREPVRLRRLHLVRQIQRSRILRCCQRHLGRLLGAGALPVRRVQGHLLAGLPLRRRHAGPPLLGGRRGVRSAGLGLLELAGRRWSGCRWPAVRTKRVRRRRRVLREVEHRGCHLRLRGRGRLRRGGDQGRARQLRHGRGLGRLLQARLP